MQHAEATKGHKQLNTTKSKQMQEKNTKSQPEAAEGQTQHNHYLTHAKLNMNLAYRQTTDNHE
jgi:hypothetical protein